MGAITITGIASVMMAGTAFFDWREGKREQAVSWGVPALLGAILVVLHILGVRA